MNVSVLTAIYGGYEHPKVLPHGINGVLWTDDYDIGLEADEAGWNVVLDEDPTGDMNLSPMLKAKYIKTHPLECALGADVSIWLDGSMSIITDNFVRLCLDALGDNDIVMTPHPLRDCIYPEAAVTKALARYGDCDPIKQVNFYRDVVGHPVRWGLFASGASVRRHNDAVEAWGKHWWDDCVHWTYQDQLSLPVITRLMTLEGRLKWTANMPWAAWWGYTEHGR